MGIAYNTSIVRDGLVLHLDAANVKSYSGSGTVWKDLSGNGNTGTLANGSVYNSGDLGYITLDGVNDYVATPNSADLISVGNGDFALDAWFQVSGTKTINHSVVRRDNLLVEGGENRRIIYLFVRANTNVGSFGVYDGSSNSATGTQDLNDGLWHHMVGVYESSTKTQYLYIDGDLQAQAVYNNAQPFNTANSPYVIGTTSPAYVAAQFFGNVSQVKIYNKALTATEVKQNFEATRGRYGL